MKRLALVLALLPVALSLGAQEFHSLWVVPKKADIGEATAFGPGKVTPLYQGWQFNIPVKDIPAGSYIEWDFTISASSAAPEYYAIEYLDGSEWKTDGIISCTRTDDTTKEVTTEQRTFRLDNAISGGDLILRIRAVTEGIGKPRFPVTDKTAASVRYLGTSAPKDTTRLLCIGNSFTYVAQASWMLKEIAWSQGHFLDMQDALKGGQTFGQHLGLSVTADKIKEGRYDVVLLQNQSQTNAWYAQDPKGNAQILSDGVELARRIRRWSPTAKLYFESTWSYPGKDTGGFASVEEFDKLMEKGTRKIAKAAKGFVSPIGRAYALSRSERPDIVLLGDDDKHQNAYGSYLKACVNYLVLFGEPFTGTPHDCSLDPEKTAYLRSVAQRVVL